MTTPRRRPHSLGSSSHPPSSHLRVVPAQDTPTLRGRGVRRYDPVEAGDVLKGRFLIEHRIGSGGMGVVYGGRHLELDQPIAIKFLLADDAERDVRRFLKEARAVASLDSPHVARVLDAGVMATRRGGVLPFIVMEQLKGSDLQAFLALRGRLPVAEAVEYLIQACSGVAEARAAGIVHRDLKPANLFLTARRDGAPLIKLLDFGISKNLAHPPRSVDLSLTGEGETVGSPLYMSPEQARAARHIDERADIWSLGVILHELLTGTSAFAGETVSELLGEVLYAQPRPIRQHAPDVPPELISVVLRCLQKERDARYATVEELAKALAPFRSEKALAPFSRDVPRLGAPVALGSEVDVAVDVDDDAFATTVARRARWRGKRLLMFTLGALGLALFSLVALAMLPTAESTRPVTVDVEPTPLAPPPVADTEVSFPTVPTMNTALPEPSPPPIAATARAGVPDRMAPAIATTTRPNAPVPLAAPVATTPSVETAEAWTVPTRGAARETPSSPSTRGAPPASATARPAPTSVRRQRTEW